MSVTTTPDVGSAAVPPGAVAEAQRTAADGAAGDDGPVTDILGKLGLIEDEGGEDLETAAAASAAALKDEGKSDGDGVDADAKAKAAETLEDEDAKRLREINARSSARKKVKEAAAAKRAGSQGTQATPAVASAQAATKAAQEAAEAAEKAKAKPADAPKNETVAAMMDIMRQIEKLAGDDEEAEKAKAAGEADKTKDARAEALAGIREQVAKMAEGLKETGELKEQLAKLQADLKSQADDATVKRVISSAVDAIADEVPLVAGGKRHEMQVTIDGAKKTVRWTGPEILHWQAGRFYEKYGVAPDLKELARRIEKKLTGEGSEKNGVEKTNGTRKTVSTSHSSPPAARQSPEKLSPKEAEAAFFKRLGVED